MDSNIKYPIALFLVSFVLFLGAALLVTTHWPGAQLMVFGMLIAQGIAVLWLMLLLLKYKFPIVLFLASFILFLAGLLFRILHWPGGLFITGIMTLVLIGALIWLIVILLKETKPV